MPKMYLIKEVDAPPKGLLTRVMISVKTAATGSAKNARIIIAERSFTNDAAGWSALATAYKFHVYDTNITGALDVPVDSVGVKIDRIFNNGGLDYENRDDDGAGLVTGWGPKSTAKKAKLYVYIELDDTEAVLDMSVDIKTQEKA